MAVQGIFNLKFLGPISFAILILGALGFTQEAEAAFSITAIKDGDWDVGSTWVGGVAPITITSFDTVIIPSGITVTIPSDVTITVTGFGGTFGNIAGTIDNSGTINITGFGNINNIGGTINNFDTINNSGFIANSGGTINNFGNIGNLGTIEMREP